MTFQTSKRGETGGCRLVKRWSVVAHPPSKRTHRSVWRLENRSSSPYHPLISIDGLRYMTLRNAYQLDRTSQNAQLMGLFWIRTLWDVQVSKKEHHELPAFLGLCQHFQTQIPKRRIMIGSSKADITDLRLKAAKTAILVTRCKINIRFSQRQPPAHNNTAEATSSYRLIASSTSVRRIRISPAWNCWRGIGMRFYGVLIRTYVIVFAIADGLSIFDIPEQQAAQLLEEYMTCKTKSAYRFILPISHVKSGKWLHTQGTIGRTTKSINPTSHNSDSGKEILVCQRSRSP